MLKSGNFGVILMSDSICFKTSTHSNDNFKKHFHVVLFIMKYRIVSFSFNLWFLQRLLINYRLRNVLATLYSPLLAETIY